MRRNSLLSAALLLCLLGLSTPLFAQSVDDLKAKSNDAAGKGLFDQAAQYMCQAAKLKPNDTDLSGLCNSMTRDAQKQEDKTDGYMSDGEKAAKSGDFDGAERMFKRVKFGRNYADAQDWIKNKIPQMKSQQAGAAAAEQQKQQLEAKEANTFADALKLYNAGDLKGAKDLFNQIQGSRKGDAQTYLGKIRDSEQAAVAANNKKQQDQQAQARQAEEDKKRAEQNKAQAVTVLAEARALDAKHDDKNARDKYRQVLTLDPTNQEAKDALVRLRPLEDDKFAANLLNTAVKDFYAGDFQTSEKELQNYVDGGGARQGIANFFLGATRLSRYYTEGNADAKAQADKAFAAAKKVNGFKVPDGAVSPKILKSYNQAPS